MAPEESGAFLFFAKKNAARVPTKWVRGGGPTMLISLESIYRAAITGLLKAILAWQGQKKQPRVPTEVGVAFSGLTTMLSSLNCAQNSARF